MPATRSPWPPKVASSSRKRDGGSSMRSLVKGRSGVRVQAASGALVGLYWPERVRWRMLSRNPARSATALDPFLPQLAEGLLGERRQVAGVCPGTHRSRERPHEALPYGWLLRDPAGLRAGPVKGGTLHGLLEALEHQALRPAREPLLDLAVPELQEEVMQWYAHGAGLPARAAKGGGVGQVFGFFVAFQERRDDRSDRTRVRRAVGVAAGLAVDGTNVQARAAADAVEGLLELRAQELRAAVVHKDQVHLLRAVELSFTPGSGHEVGVDGYLLPRPVTRE